ncbi:MAG: hypothetical protein LBI05_06805 [Planctomycetaceae bacterium]|jgi:hypothetical protein|nr:hypothetical protein [Planctomycetaceae bacterium]
MSSFVQDDQTVDAAAFQAEFEALYIPPNIDPRLLALWVEREQEKIASSQRIAEEPPPKKVGRGLARLFPAYIGISIMCLSVILGIVQGKETADILQTACVVFLSYSIIGVFVGVIAERCVHDSVETLLRDIVTRSKEAAQNAEITSESQM